MPCESDDLTPLAALNITLEPLGGTRPAAMPPPKPKKPAKTAKPAAASPAGKTRRAKKAS
jgi:hypothetical protein